MFSGIIEKLGRIEAVTAVGNGRRFRISSSLEVAPAGEAGIGTADRERVGLGDSIAVHGVCLTVDEVYPPHEFAVVCGNETVMLTKLGQFDVGSRVHLERALRLGDRLDGHLVQGHVDGVGYIRTIDQNRESWILWIDVPVALSQYVVVKGSITIDGVSLTVNDIHDSTVRVNVIPYTSDETTLVDLRPGQSVNLEVDLIARYVESLLRGYQRGSSLQEFLSTKRNTY